MEQGCEFWRRASVTYIDRAEGEKTENGADAGTLEEEEEEGGRRR